MTFATVATVVGIAGGINSLTGGGITKSLGLGPKDTPASPATSNSPATPSSAGGAIDPKVQAAADPFAAYRPEFAQQYAAAMAPGAKTDPTQMPGYSQFQSGVLDPSMEATKRSMAASGQFGSGNEMAALQKQGSQGYYGFMTDYMNRLATGAGVSQGPAQGAQMGLGAANAQQQGVSQGFGAVATGLSGLSGLFKGSGSTQNNQNYNSYSSDWVQQASENMPSTYSAGDPALEWSM
jgi:hypothetical protein